MKILNAILLTLAWMLFIELINAWTLLIPADWVFSESIIKVSHLISYLVVLFAMILLFKIFKQPEALTVSKAKPTFYVIGIMSGIAFVFLQSILLTFYFQEISSEFFRWDFSLELLTTLPFFIIGSVLIVPITEELFFRNFILRGLLKNNDTISAILISSLLFSFVHIPFINFLYDSVDFSLRQAYITIFGGVIAGSLYCKSKSIIPPILFHMFWNLSAAVF